MGCQVVLSKAEHWHAVMSEVPFKTSTPFKIILKFWGGHGPPGPPTNEATGRGLVSILRLGGPILLRNFEIFEKICTYLVNPKILGGPWPPWPPQPQNADEAPAPAASLQKVK